MIKLTDNIWIGDSKDEEHADLATARIGAVLNVAHDLVGTRSWMDGLEYAHIGLIDGPGNHLSAYYAAVFELASLIQRHKKVLVCCHTGGRSMAVALMYFNLTYNYGWDICVERLQERTEEKLPVPHEAHKLAFHKINTAFVTRVMGW